MHSVGTDSTVAVTWPVRRSARGTCPKVVGEGRFGEFGCFDGGGPPSEVDAQSVEALAAIPADVYLDIDSVEHPPPARLDRLAGWGESEFNFRRIHRSGT